MLLIIKKVLYGSWQVQLEVWLNVHVKYQQRRQSSFPFLATKHHLRECPNFKTEAELGAFAKADIDQVKTIMATVDGQRLPDSDLRRLESPPFELDLPEGNVAGAPSGKTKSKSDGYWVFLKPLPVGRHQIHFFSSCRIGTQWIEAWFNLTVR